ncbi:MFS transporter [Rhodococcus ruber BKS 20-38]|uniref:MFS transporter n=2 Tax=Rhodococcus ruber TaxID=1830 RepID=M2ZQ01_9NOCA|nr:MFS transporter [Rhodococcus ruber BKS 20-38]
MLGIVLLIEAVTLAYLSANTALPSIAEHYGTTQTAWILTTYALSGAVTAPIFGKLADRHGKRRILLLVMFVSVIGSLICATAPTFGVLLAGRAFEGCLIASMFLSYSLIRDVYPPRTVPFAASISVTGAGILSIVLPTLVGFFLDGYGFRSVFVLSAIWVGLMIVVIGLTTDETPVRTPADIDTLGAVLLGAGLAGLLTAVSMGNGWGWTNSKTVGLFAGGAILLICYARSALHRTDPVFDVRLFQRRGFLFAAIVAGVCYGLGTVFQVCVALIGLTPDVLGGGYGLGLSATALSQITTPYAVSTAVAGISVGLCMRRFGPWNTARFGMAVLLVGALVMASRHDTFTELLISVMICGIGIGITSGSIPNLVIAISPVAEQGSISAAVQVFISGVGAIAPVLLFLVLGRSATVVPGGSQVYTDAAITVGLTGCAALAAIGVALTTTVLRPSQLLVVPKTS